MVAEYETSRDVTDELHEVLKQTDYTRNDGDITPVPDEPLNMLKQPITCEYGIRLPVSDSSMRC
jgi:hypothetical protein